MADAIAGFDGQKMGSPARSGPDHIANMVWMVAAYLSLSVDVVADTPFSPRPRGRTFEPDGFSMSVVSALRLTSRWNSSINVWRVTGASTVLHAEKKPCPNVCVAGCFETIDENQALEVVDFNFIELELLACPIYFPAVADDVFCLVFYQL